MNCAKEKLSISKNKSFIFPLYIILYNYFKSYTQAPRVDNEASIFSIGGTWAKSLISSDSAGLHPVSASYTTKKLNNQKINTWM